MKIKSIEVFKGRLNLLKTFRISYGEWSSVDTVFIKTVLDDGSVGWGEAPPAPEITGDTPGSITSSIGYIADYLKGLDVEDIWRLDKVIRGKLKKNSSAVNGLVNSILDAISKSKGISLLRLLGGPGSETEVITDITVGLDSPEVMAKDALDWVEKGFRQIKVKLGGPESLDIERIKEIRNAIGLDVRLRVDANQAWSPKEAVRIGKFLERMEVEMIEQPVKADNINGLKYVKERLEIPIVADESVHDSNDLKTIIYANAADGINIKLSKSGGLLEALKMALIAKSFNLKLMVGCMIESSLGIAFAAHLVATTRAFEFVDLDSDITLKEQPLRRGIRREGERILLDPSVPGVGVEPDEKELEILTKIEL